MNAEAKTARLLVIAHAAAADAETFARVAGHLHEQVSNVSSDVPLRDAEDPFPVAISRYCQALGRWLTEPDLFEDAANAAEAVGRLFGAGVLLEMFVQSQRDRGADGADDAE